ncbi:hypothetical protein [Lysobacter sp. HA18]
MDPATLYLRTAETARTSLASLAREPAKRAYVPINYRIYLQSASGYSLHASSDIQSYVAELERFKPVDTFTSMLEFVESGEFPALFASCSANDVDLLAVPLLLGRNDLARRYLEGFLLTSSSGPFWSSYVQGLGALARGLAFDPNLPTKPRGMEKHWLLYVQLMSAMTGGDPTVGSAKANIEASFRHCNRDKRLTMTSHIDPNGTHPVSWDLRLAYVLAAAGLGPNNSSKPTPLRGAA